MNDKKTIRTQTLNIRNSITAAQKQHIDNRLKERLFRNAKFLSANAVLAYVSYNSEADTIEIIRRLLDEKRLVCVPRVCGDTMDFYRIHSTDDLTEGYKGILEPAEECELYIPENGDVILVPGSAFDRNLYRIGYGKGYYDRYLSKYDRLYSIGLAYGFQVYDKIPVDEWDYSLDIIITDKEEITYD